MWEGCLAYYILCYGKSWSAVDSCECGTGFFEVIMICEVHTPCVYDKSRYGIES